MQFTEPKTIEIVLNGEPRSISGGLTVLGLLHAVGVDPARVAVELNRSIVRLPEWDVRVIEPGALVEIVQFVGGG